MNDLATASAQRRELELTRRETELLRREARLRNDVQERAAALDRKEADLAARERALRELASELAAERTRMQALGWPTPRRASRAPRPRLIPASRRPEPLPFQALGALAQLGERRLCKPKVTGSIPVRSTTKSPATGSSAVLPPFCCLAGQRPDLGLGGSCTSGRSMRIVHGSGRVPARALGSRAGTRRPRRATAAPGAGTPRLGLKPPV